MLVYPGNLPPCNDNSYADAGFNISQTPGDFTGCLHRCDNENMHGCCRFSGHRFGRGHSALAGTESCSCLARPDSDCLSEWPRSAGEARLSTLYDAICLERLPGQKRSVLGKPAFNDTWNSRSDMSACIILDRCYLCVHNLVFSTRGPCVLYWPIHPIMYILWLVGSLIAGPFPHGPVYHPSRACFYPYLITVLPVCVS